MTPQGFRGHPGPPGGSRDDPECIFVITEVCGTTLISNISWFGKILKWPPQGFRGHPRPPGGSGDDPECIFVITKVCGTTLLNNIFPYHQLLKWPPGAPPSVAGYRGRIQIAYSMLPDIKALTFNQLFCLNKRFPRSLRRDPVTDTPKSTHKYLLDCLHSYQLN